MSPKAGGLSVTVVVPNYNGRGLLERYFPSAVRAAEACPGTEVIVVDDASADDSVDYVRRAFPGVGVIERPVNGGFGEACNTGAQAARGDILAFVMTDLEVEPGFLLPLVGHFDGAATFAVGPRIRIRDSGEHSNASITRLVLRHGMFHIEQPFGSNPARGNGQPEEVVFVPGGAMACDRAKFLELGGFDPIFAPFCWEDVDICYRARKRGWRVVSDPRSVVVHPKGHATIDQLPESIRAGEIARRNELLFTWLNLHDRVLLAKHWAWLAVRLLRRAVRADRGYLRAFGRAVRRAPAAIRARRIRRAEAQLTDRQVLGMTPRGEGQ
jgi:GT2 family glycosyltransferase